MITAEQALDKLKTGNRLYLTGQTPSGDVSPEIRAKTAEQGQQPYAIVVCCSDSRVIPEAIFSAGIGEIFVIRVAGNVIDKHQLGSIEYAADHLGCKLVVVMGHDRCGAVDAALHHATGGYIKSITDQIQLAVGDEKDPVRASCLNALHGDKQIEQSLDIGLSAVAAIYHIATGEVEFLQA